MHTSDIAKDLLVIQKDDTLSYDLLMKLADSSELLKLYVDYYGSSFYKQCIFSLTHISIDEAQSQEKWFQIIAHRKALNEALQRDVGLKVAAIDYLENFSDKEIEMTAIESDKVDDIISMATTDPLTSLYIRSMFDEMLSKEFEQYHRIHQPLSVLMIDIDNFKHYNDTYGHQKGDEVLRSIGGILHKSVRKSDIACRYGGEELAVIMPNTDKETASEVAERIRHSIESYQSDGVHVTVSIGVSEASASTKNESSLLRQADEALYQAKEQGKNRIVKASKS